MSSLMKNCTLEANSQSGCFWSGQIWSSPIDGNHLPLVVNTTIRIPPYTSRKDTFGLRFLTVYTQLGDSGTDSNVNDLKIPFAIPFLCRQAGHIL